ncbi:MAG: hypothetical protein CV045_02955 [Cyanobacteria bacterium M5B4]|nr:MAG: hypothetical protein CV045_02955 [Cyanobacteria bacterium M5B4]
MSVSVSNIATLKTIRADQANGVIRWVTEKISWYYPSADSTLTPDDDAVVQPNVGTGRWLKQESAVKISDIKPTQVVTSDVNPILSGTRYVVDTANLTTNSIVFTLPSNPISFGETDIVIQGTNLSKVIEIIASGQTLINNEERDIREALINGQRFRIIYGGTSIGWIVSKIDTLALTSYPRGQSNVFTRDWDGTGNYDFNLGLIDVIGRDFDLNNTWTNPNKRSWGEVHIGSNNNTTNSYSNFNTVENITLFVSYGYVNVTPNFFSRLNSENSNSTNSSYSLGILKTERISFWCRGKGVPGSPNIALKPSKVLIIYKHYATISGAVTISNLTANGIKTLLNPIIMGSIDAEIIQPNSSITDRTRIIERSSGSNLFTLHGRGIEVLRKPNTLTNFNSEVILVDHTKLPSPYNNNNFFGILYTLEPTSTYFNNFSFEWIVDSYALFTGSTYVFIHSIDFFGTAYPF